LFFAAAIRSREAKGAFAPITRQARTETIEMMSPMIEITKLRSILISTFVESLSMGVFL
jgi:hypothetical protein